MCIFSSFLAAFKHLSCIGCGFYFKKIWQPLLYTKYVFVLIQDLPLKIPPVVRLFILGLPPIFIYELYDTFQRVINLHYCFIVFMICFYYFITNKGIKPLKCKRLMRVMRNERKIKEKRFNETEYGE